MLLKSTLSQVELECQAARTQVSALQRKLHALELEVEVCTCRRLTCTLWSVLYCYAWLVCMHQRRAVYTST